MLSQLRDRSRTSFRLAGFFVALAIALLLTAAAAEGPLAQEEGTQPQDQKPSASNKEDSPTFEPPAKDKEVATDQIIVKFKENASSSTRAEARRAAGLEKKKDLNLIDAEVDKVKGQSLERAIEALKRRPDVEYAEEDYIHYPSGYADEPQFGQLWGLDNTGQSIDGISGTADMDINAKEASAVTQGDQNLLVAVIDDGVDFTHPDLKDRAWKNPGESGSGKETNGVDDDGNGKVDDVNGWDFYYDDKTVHDPGEDAHGTHVSGTLAASVNGDGVVGVAPNIQIMALKFLGPNGGYTSDAIDALGYAKSKGAKISNNSWGGGGYTQALYDAINNSGSLFVAAAGNAGNNNDAYPFYPASYSLSNILSVGAVDNQGKLASFSNYGATSVDISAPGVSILSSVPGIPGDAATLSSVGSSGGKALTAGFGAEEIGESAKRTSFFNKAFTAVDRGSQQVVLVDDDADDVGFPDAEPSVSAAIQGATGSAPQVIDVPYRSDGPDLSQLSGKTVVWATGQAYLSDDNTSPEAYYPNITKTTLTSTDQTTLKNFLDGGGKLIITGMNAFYLIENSSFVTSTLGLKVQSEVGNSVDATTFKGSSGTAFDGESYAFDSPTAYAPYHDMVTPAASAAVSQGSYTEVSPTWKSWNGTSMATPHATGAAALVASVEPTLLGNPGGLKNRIMNGKPLVAAAGKTVSGDMADALKAARPPSDTTAPTIISSGVTPTDGAKNVDTTTKVVATFSEAMDAASVTDPANFTLRKVLEQGCTTTVPATLSYDSDDPATKKATLVPSAPLDASSTYTATVSGAWDLAGNQLDQDPNTSGDQPWTSSFTTAAPPPGTSSPMPNVWAWGYNEYGQLGDCTTTDSTTPVQASDLSGVTDVAGGRGHSLALKDDRTVWAWGANWVGQLGDGNTTPYPSGSPTPVKVSGLSGITDVASGEDHSLALKDDGTAWAWGYNDKGQLGDGTTTYRPTPVKVSGLSGITHVASGVNHGLAVKDDGTAWAWGYNQYGQLGNGTNPDSPPPVKVSGLSGVTDVAGGWSHSVALKDDGTVWAWGTNWAGQLGNGTSDYNRHPTPVQVSGLSGITDVSAGGGHSLALKDDGTLWAWGQNNSGQLGIGTITDSTTPVKVSGLSSVVAMSAGGGHSLAAKDDGTVWAWGRDYGGGPYLITIPAQLSGLSGITDVVGGMYHSFALTTSNSATVTVDKTAPTVTESSLSPASGATNVARNTSVTGTFSEKMDPNSITTSTFKLYKCPSTTSTNCTTQVTNVSVSPSNDGLSATLDPSDLLGARTRYKAVVTTGAKDVAGNALNQQKNWYFTTGR